MFQNSSVMSPNLACLRNQRDEPFCHRARRRGNHAAANEGKLAGLPKWRCNKTACLTDGSGRPGGGHVARGWVVVDVASPPRLAVRL